MRQGLKWFLNLILIRVPICDLRNVSIPLSLLRTGSVCTSKPFACEAIIFNSLNMFAGSLVLASLTCAYTARGLHLEQSLEEGIVDSRASGDCFDESTHLRELLA